MEKITSILLAFILVIVAYGVAASGNELIKKSPEVLATIFSAILVFIAATYGKFLEKRMELRFAHNVQKKELYQKFLDVVNEMILGEKQVSKSNSNRQVENLRKVQQNLVLWASADVIKKYNSFIEELGVYDKPSVGEKEDIRRLLGVVNAMQNLIKAMRKDLGFDDNKLGEHTLMKLYVRRDEWNKFERL